MPSFNSSLFKNDKKATDSQPDFTGPGNISKEEFLKIYDQVMQGQYNADDRGDIKLRVAGWKRTTKTGDRSYISLQLSVDDYNVQPKATPAVTTQGEDLF